MGPFIYAGCIVGAAFYFGGLGIATVYLACGIAIFTYSYSTYGE